MIHEFDLDNDNADEVIEAMVRLQDLAFGEGWGGAAFMRDQIVLGGKVLLLTEPLGEGGAGEEGQELVVGGRRALVGMRIFMPPGSWGAETFADLAPCSRDEWKALGFSQETLALARSIIIHPKRQRRGLGERLLVRSLEWAKVIQIMSLSVPLSAFSSIFVVF